MRISRAIVQSCTDCGTPVADPDFPHEDEHGRLYKVWGTDRCAVPHRAALCLELNVRSDADAEAASDHDPAPPSPSHRCLCDSFMVVSREILLKAPAGVLPKSTIRVGASVRQHGGSVNPPVC